MEIKQSTSALALVFFMVDSTDHVTGKTGLSPTVVMSKNGATFASPIGAVQQIGNGFYKVVGNALDSDTLGVLALYATAATADPCAMAYEVVANIESDSITAIAGVDDHITMYEEGLDVVIGSAVRTELATELAMVDAAISTRASIASTGAQIAAFETA
jgi:hypothetical protein